MSALVLTRENGPKLTDLQIKCDLFSKQCAVLLGVAIPLSTAATHIILFFLIISWFLAGNIQEKAKIVWAHPISRVFLLFFGVFVIGALYSVAPSEDSIEALGKMGKLLYLPFLLPVFAEAKWRGNVIWAFIGAMVVTFLLSGLKQYIGSTIYTHFAFGAVFKDPIYTNYLMAFAAFMVGHYLFQPSRLLTRLALFGLLMGFIYYVFFMSMGRSGYMVFTTLWLLFCLQRLSLKGMAAGLIGLSLLLGLVFLVSKPFQLALLSGVENVEQYQTGKTNTSLGSRLEFYNQTWQLAKQRPWFGFGTGSFKQAYATHATTHDLQTTKNPHNEYLNILFQVGMVGLVAFLGFFALIFKKSFSLPDLEKWFAQGVLVAMMVGCFVNSWLMDSTSGYFFVILTALCFGALRTKEDLPSE